MYLLYITSGCPWPKATLKSPLGARDLGPLWSFIRFIFSCLLLFIWPLPCRPFYFFLSFTLYLAPALPALLFFLIFYSLFGPCPSRTFIFPYLLLFIWPLPYPPFYFSLSFTLYLAPALPARPCPLPCPARQTDRRTLPCPLPRPALSGRPFFRIPGPVFRIPFSESDCPGRFPVSESDCPGLGFHARCGKRHKRFFVGDFLFVESDYPRRFSVSESDCPGRFRQSIKTRNRRWTHRRTHML